jgi:V-type H+-transporting ATPase subunit E
MNKMRKRQELLDKLYHETLNKLGSFAKPDNSKYRDLIKQLIVQGMTKLIEPKCFIRVRKMDVDFVKKLLSECQREYKELMRKETGEEYECVLEVDTDTYLESE